MKRNNALLGAATLACLAFALPIQDTRQDAKQEEPGKRIDALVKALDLEKRKTADLEKRTRFIEERLELIDSWFVTVRSASDLLDLAADEARRNGFESAGANPFSKTNVIEGMKGFAAELIRDVPPPVVRERR